jgi:GntR family transcriptional regulator
VPDTSDSRPPYLAVADRLKERIASGEFAPGSQLPSGRELAAEYAVAPNTVLSAIRQLRDDGLVVSQQGRGTFVREDAAVQLRSGGSPEFRLLMERLDAMAGALDVLSARVTELEDAAQTVRPGGAGPSSSPDATSSDT